MHRQYHVGVQSWWSLQRVVHKVGRRLALHLENYELTPAQCGVLTHLQLAPEISQQTLADRLFVTKGNMVGLLDRMERRGLIQRRSDPEDGRSRVVSLTERGEQLAAQVIPEQEALIIANMERVS